MTEPHLRMTEPHLASPEATRRRSAMGAESIALSKAVARYQSGQAYCCLLIAFATVVTLGSITIGSVTVGTVGSSVTLAALLVEDRLGRRRRRALVRRRNLVVIAEGRCEWCGRGFTAVESEDDYESLVCPCGKTAWLDLTQLGASRVPPAGRAADATGQEAP